MIVNRNTFAQRQTSTHPFDVCWKHFHFVISFLISPAEYQAPQLTDRVVVHIFGHNLEPDGDGECPILKNINK